MSMPALSGATAAPLEPSGQRPANQRCAVLCERIGPYHFARLSSLARRLSTVVIESFGMDSTYAWKKVAGAGGFERLTLFEQARPGPEQQQALICRVTETLQKASPAVVVIPGWADKAALAALSWCERTGTPAVVMSASSAMDAPRVWWKEAVKSRIVRLCSAGLGGGTPHVDYLVDLGLPRERVFAGYDVVDNEYFWSHAAQARLDADRVRAQFRLPREYFVASSRFVEKKNLPRLLQAYASYRRQAGAGAWKLVLIGEGPLKPDLLRVRSELDLVDDILLPGFVQYEDLPAHYALAGTFIHASTSEQWGLVVNEAMACGLPVLVSKRCGCVSDLVVDGRNGYTFDPYDPAALADLMLRLASHGADRVSMGEASRAIITGWSPETFAANLTRAVAVARSAPRLKGRCVGRLLLRRWMGRGLACSNVAL
jgi:glycosyltransferase involved in cell wall biosynthesis